MTDLLEQSNDRLALIEVLEGVNVDSCPNDYNFHLHTQFSDGQSQPIDLFQQAIDLGLKGLAITDHHSVRAYHTIQRWVDQAHLSPTEIPRLWTGVEITSTLLGTDVHILGLAYNPGARCIQPYLTGESVEGSARNAARVIKSIHEAGGVAILAHPARYKKPPAPLVKRAVELGIDGVEAFYCYGSDRPWIPSEPQTTLMMDLSDRYQLLKSCGTDTHGLDITRRR